ncbi:alpha/beta fold hydrolase [Bacillus solimangrovi]|uniref:2-hydroxy-6-oxo-6-phenylhexa-2,4-dienoate hydrolase n=1 Tax=Bacillus solimangrovi TaxID=1305675 RepID=A0A1E5LE42_9BACI|nr:alpha/beta hydrolase [Bacillus solimangrovi]OEH92355.1 2-hydroxy-6-oxo-6-phenylhexa-2,4-dienoate hydrolase [Bacillus solimangrovi]
MSYIVVNNVKVNYEVYGSGMPIIMIHGFTVDMRLMKGCMEPVFSEREEGFKRIYIDLPGMGKTKDYEEVHSTDDMLEVVMKFIDTVIPNQSYLVVGESYGGYVARGLIAKRRGNVAGAAFICPMIIPEQSKRKLPAHTIVSKDETFFNQLEKDVREDFSSNVVVLNQHTWERYKKEILVGCNIADEQFLSKILDQYGFTYDIDQVSFEKPSVFLLGKQDSVVGYKDALQLIDHYPKATFAIVEGAGHNLQIEQRLLFDVNINHWLDRITDK